MSIVKLISKNIWVELTNAVKKTRTKSIVAVAYFGQNGSKMLPLKKGSVLVVDASQKALKMGQTNPDELLKLYDRGVHIYSRENLHAKLYLFGNTLYCGSANVSGNSANRLKEVLLKTNNKEVLKNAKIFINSICRIELGDEEIKRMKKIYVPPKNFGGGKKTVVDNLSSFHIVNLRLVEWTEKEQLEADKGEKIARRNRINKSRHRVDVFSYGSKVSFMKGDTILQITKEEDKKYATPIGKLIHIRKWSNGKTVKHFCYVEVPDKRRKNLEALKKQLNKEDAKAVLRGGRKNLELEGEIRKLWL